MKFKYKNIKTAVLRFLPFAVIIIALSGIIFVTEQQILRQDGNDPQVAMATDLSKDLVDLKSNVISYLQSQKKVDINKSLATFVIVFDDKGAILASTASINGHDPIIPLGALQASKTSGSNKITWEPQKGTRIAAVIKPFNDSSTSGFVLVGRNLKEVESREDQLFKEVSLSSMSTLLITFFILLFI